MLTIVCGEDSTASRNYFSGLKKDFRAKNFEIYEVDPRSVGEILNWMSDAPSLFSPNKAFFTQSLNKTISKKTNPKQIKIIDDIINNKEVQLYDWESETPARYLKISTGITVKEFKLSNSIFKLADSCFPGNIDTFIKSLHELSDNTEEIFTFIMLSRHIRNLMLVKLDKTPPGMFSWQAAKLKNQAAKWPADRLVSFYDNLHKIDVSLKTSTLPYSLTSALDIMAVYYL